MNNSYKGTCMKDMYQGLGPWSFETPPIVPSKFHSVLFEIPINLVAPPAPHKTRQQHHWEDGYVRMPYSDKNVFPAKNVNDLVLRWELIKKALSHPISSSREMEEAINSYNSKSMELTSLHVLFEQIYSAEETSSFFENELPKIINLALQLPEIVPGNIPLLKALACYSVSLSQMQVACLLANAFLCTFPWRKDIANTYPGINFIRLFSAFDKDNPNQAVIEKIKCVLHYFHRIFQKPPVGVVTFERQHLRRNKCPRWDHCENNLGNTKLHVTSLGTIEDDGLGLMQVDFANKFVGGGVLGNGCVQEEIRYVICPELIVMRLFAEKLESTESLIVIGVERFSKYEGYSSSFKWAGDYVDNTPYDDDGRRRTSIVAIDATKFNSSSNQFHTSQILRELNKAFSGFYSRLSGRIPPIGTGNWGCGAFRGDTHLKFLIQLMACSAANRDIVYYTFKNEELKDNIYNMYIFIANNQITISQLWRILCRFTMANLPADKLYPFIQQSYFDLKKQPCITSFFPPNGASTSSTAPEARSTSPETNNAEVIRPKTNNAPVKSKDCLIMIEAGNNEEARNYVKKKCVKALRVDDGNNSDDDFDVLASIGKIEGDKKVVAKSSSEDYGEGFFDLIKKKKDELKRKPLEGTNMDVEFISQEINDNTTVSESPVVKSVALDNNINNKPKPLDIKVNRTKLPGKNVEASKLNGGNKVIISEKRKITDYFGFKM